MLTIINRVVGLVPPLVWAGMVIVLFGMFGAQSWRLASCNRALGAAKVAVDIAKGINERNTVVVASLQQSTAACLDGRRVDEGKFTAARTAWVIRRVELEADAKIERVKEIEVYRDPDCRDLAKLDISAICPELVKQWRERLIP